MRSVTKVVGMLSALALTLFPARTIAQVPRLELVGEYSCATCSADSGLTPVRIRAVAAGPNSFAAVFDASPTQPVVRIWNLDSGAITQFGTRRDSARVFPIGLTLLRDSVIFAESRPLLNVFSRTGAFLGTKTFSDVRPLGGPTPRPFASSPSGRWALAREIMIGGVSNPIVRIDRQSGTIDRIDIPLQLIAGSTNPDSKVAQDISGMAIADDGTLALGNGYVGYRLMLIPSQGGARIEGGRSLPMPPHSAKQLESLRRTNPPDLARRIQAGAGHFSSDALQFDDKGRLWVRATRGGDAGVSSVFDVFSPQLVFLGEVRLPNGVSLFQIASGLLVGQTSTEGGHTITVWRIREP